MNPSIFVHVPICTMNSHAIRIDSSVAPAIAISLLSSSGIGTAAPAEFRTNPFLIHMQNSAPPKFDQDWQKAVLFACLLTSGLRLPPWSSGENGWKELAALAGWSESDAAPRSRKRSERNARERKIVNRLKYSVLPHNEYSKLHHFGATPTRDNQPTGSSDQKEADRRIDRHGAGLRSTGRAHAVDNCCRIKLKQRTHNL